MYVIAHTIRKI